MGKYLDATGLTYFYNQIKSKFAAASHNHSAANITSGTLAVARGGTGVTANPSMLTNLGSTSAVSVFATSPRPGVTGTLHIANGGTGANNSADALRNLKAIGNRGAINVDNEYGSFFFSSADGVTGFTPVGIDGDYNVLQIGSLTDISRDRVQLYFNGDRMYSRANDSDSGGTNEWTNWLLHEQVAIHYNDNNTGYVRYSSGFQICWGLQHYKSSSAGSLTISFGLPFPSTYGDPVLNVTFHGATGKIASWSNTGFTVYCQGDTYIMYIAIGRWK